MRRTAVEDEGSSPLATTQTNVPIRTCRGGFPDRKRGFRAATQTDVPLRTCRVGFPGRKCGFRAATQTGWANGPCRGRQAFVDCLSLRRLSPKCARRTGHRQRGIRFCCAHSPLTGRCAQLAFVIRHLAGPSCAHFGGKHRAADKPGDEYRQADYCFDATVM